MASIKNFGTLAVTRAKNPLAKSAIVALYFNGFAGLYTELKALLDKVRNGGKDAAKAYSDAQSGKLEYGKDPDGKVKIGSNGQPSEVKVIEKGAKAIIEGHVNSLSPEHIGYLSGLGFTAPNDDKKKRTDIVNSVLSAWDKPAAKYMKQELSAGDGAVPAFKQRLEEFDTAIRTQGKTPVKPDA